MPSNIRFIRSPRKNDSHDDGGVFSCDRRTRRFIVSATTLTLLVIGLIFQGTLLAIVTKNSYPSEKIVLDNEESIAILPVNLVNRLLQEEEERRARSHQEEEALFREIVKGGGGGGLLASQAEGKEFHDRKQADALLNNMEERDDDDDEDKDCPFRDSPIYRSIYVYPNPGDLEWKGPILSGKYNDKPWPWIDIQNKTKPRASIHYNPKRPYIQYNSELLVQLLVTHPDSCLRSYDPETAKLFYVPYMPSLEYHNGTLGLGSYETSPFGKALMDVIDKQNYTLWETNFGLTSKYWKQNDGSDHILVFSEPLHGLYHPKSRRGNFHYVHTQKQLASPIVMSVELSTTFVKKYPNCARKNILLPYPNTDGQWFNFEFDDLYANNLSKLFHKFVDGKSRGGKTMTLLAERQLFNESNDNDDSESQSSLHLLNHPHPRPYAQYYSAGNHGSCKTLRESLSKDYHCTASFKATKNIKYEQGYRQATFCPCPGGDSPSAKRMFDALHAGCIPIILSEDFVWPFTSEFDYTMGKIVSTKKEEDSFTSVLDPNDFSIRVTAKDFNTPKRNKTSCQLLNASEPDLQAYMETLSATTIHNLRSNVRLASQAYSWYEKSRNLPPNPLIHDILPTGGTAHRVVAAWSERAEGRLWPACHQEFQTLHPEYDNNSTENNEKKGRKKGSPPGGDVRGFKC